MAKTTPTQSESDIYTILLIIGALTSIGGVVFMLFRSQELFGSWNPFLQ